MPTYKPHALRHLNNEGKKEWRRLVGALMELGLYTDLDRAALAMYCQAWGRWVEAERRLDETGGPILVAIGTGNLYQNPWLHVANKAAEQVRRMLAEFGLTPAQRSRVTATGQGEPASLADILFQGVDG